MTAMHRPGNDRMYGFLVTGTYTTDQRIPSDVLSRSVAEALEVNFTEPHVVQSYVMPTMKTPLVYDLVTMWTSMTVGERASIRTFHLGLFNAVTALLKAVPVYLGSGGDVDAGEVAQPQ